MRAQVVQELHLPGRVLGATGAPSWRGRWHVLRRCVRCGGGSLAILWTTTEVLALSAAGEGLAETLQSRAIELAMDAQGDEVLPLLCWAVDVVPWL